MSVAITTRYEPLLLRHPANPLLTAKDWPYSINSVFNAGATLLADGSTLLLCRVEDRRGLSHFCAARSRNGVDGWQIDSEPTLLSSPKDYPEEVWRTRALRSRRSCSSTWSLTLPIREAARECLWL
jgi:predicted GH43/DUF377 family glycosyl hydrolase